MSTRYRSRLAGDLGRLLTLGCSEKATYRHSREVGSPGDLQILGARLRGHDGFP